MKALNLSLVLAGMMVIAAASGMVIKPSVKAAQVGPKLVLEEAVPKQFGEWREQPDFVAQVVNPQTQELLDKLYSQILSRTYVHKSGYRIMLSLAYGEDQRGNLAVHKPEVCYPAQGFTLRSNVESTVSTNFGAIDVRRLHTTLGRRIEPVTYWFTVGDEAIQNKLQQRMVEMKMGLTGQIPDGLLFRVSSIDDQTARAFQQHDLFVNDLLKALSPRDRRRFSGLESPA